MKLWVDDERQAPWGWVRADTFWVAYAWIWAEWPRLTEISLDHDLGGEKTGYDLLVKIEEAVASGAERGFEIHVHTANPVGRKNMLAAIASIERLEANR